MNKSNVTQLSPFNVQQTPSITSSENSETQSINEEPINSNNTNNRSVTKQYNNNNNKKQNEKEKERPPWRSTANVQLKADRNALLKAKLLDASRRALRAQKTSTVSIQTDPIPTVLVKEVEIDIQTDLIEMVDQSVETDGSVTIKKESPGGFILTQTIGQMTEHISYTDVGTQTALPKTNLAFKSYLNQLPSSVVQQTNKFTLHQRDRKNPTPDPALNKPNIMSQNEELINRQINEIRRIDGLLLNNNNNNIIENELDDRKGACKNNEDNYLETNSLTDDSLQDNSIQNSTKETPRLLKSHNNSNNTHQHAKINFNEPTLTSWDHFDSDDEDDEFVTFSRSANKPNFRDFRDDIIDQRLSNMKLSPILMRRRSYLNSRNVRWSNEQFQAVNHLISESTKLMDVFDQIAIMLGPELKLKSTLVIQPRADQNKMIYVSSTPQPPPSSKLVPILTQTCELLEKQLREFDT